MSDYSDQYSDSKDDSELANAVDQPIELPLPPSERTRLRHLRLFHQIQKIELLLFCALMDGNWRLH